jgi:hypothetical protein
MDGSRRSAHANAYFTGFGAAKRVVFFDTLLAQLTPPEVEAVLAHELGHFGTGTSCSASSCCSRSASPAWHCWAGWPGRAGSTPAWASRPTCRPAWAGRCPTMRWRCCCSWAWCRCSCSSSRRWRQLSRRHEFQADAYAAHQASAQELSNALVKLYKDNASTLTPDPLYVRFYYAPTGQRAHGPPGRPDVARLSPRPPRPAPVAPGALREGLVVSSHGRHCVVETPAGERVRCHPRGKKLEVVVGDRVQWLPSQDEGTIERTLPRRNWLYRQDELRTKSFAANLDQVLVLLAAEPSSPSTSWRAR